MLHVFLLLVVLFLALWLFRQIPGFIPPMHPVVTTVLFLLVLLIFAWVWTGGEAMTLHVPKAP